MPIINGQTTKFNVILCPVDLSENSKPAIELATILAKHHAAKLNFMYVATQWVSGEAMMFSDQIQSIVEQDRETFLRLRPTDPKVEFSHTYALGNPGPEIVIASRSCDSIVMTTWGDSAFMRFLMGSVSQYVLRHADCPVILLKSRVVASSQTGSGGSEQTFVTSKMHHVRPIQGFEKMGDVLTELERAKETAAPVVNLGGECIGILTKTDIEKFHQLLDRYDERDKSVVDEIYEVDEYGHRRVGIQSFDQVIRYMSSPVVTIPNTATMQAANGLFAANSTISHLVVIDDANHPVGILDATVPQRRDHARNPEESAATEATS